MQSGECPGGVGGGHRVALRTQRAHLWKPEDWLTWKPVLEEVQGINNSLRFKKKQPGKQNRKEMQATSSDRQREGSKQRAAKGVTSKHLGFGYVSPVTLRSDGVNQQASWKGRVRSDRRSQTPA